MKVLSDPKFSHIIAWLPSGTAFVIHKPKAFATDLLPTHFKSAKFSSFTRKLHRWGFVRNFRGGESGAFSHDDFRKGRLDLAEAMTCCQQEKEAASKAAHKARGGGNSSSNNKGKQRAVESYEKTIPGLGNDNLRHIMSQRAGLPGLQQHAQLLQMHQFTASSEVANALNEYSSSSLRPNLNTMSHPPSMFQNLRSFDGAPSLSLPIDRNSMSALEQQIMKERLDAAIQDELARLEYARFTKDRVGTNAMNRYRMLHQEQQQQQQLQQIQQQQHRNNLLRLQQSSTVPLGGGLPTSSSLSPLGSSSLAPALSQLSRAELEQYAMAMSTRNLPGTMGQQRHPANHPTSNLPYNNLRDDRSNAFLPP
jgi:hypothetical protein